MPSAIITGASRGLGLALARALARDSWRLVLDARGGAALAAAANELAALTDVVALAGDVAEPAPRRELVGAAGDRVDLLVNNASLLGPSPQPALGAYPIEELRRVYRTNVFAPLALAQLLLPRLPDGAAILNVTSDAAVEPYAGWGGYGSSKAAIEQASNVLAAEETAVRDWWVDPGDLRTDMHQAAFPDQDISDRPLPESVVPALVRLVTERLPSGRYRAAELVPA